MTTKMLYMTTSFARYLAVTWKTLRGSNGEESVNLDSGPETDLSVNRPPQPRSERFASASAAESAIS